MAAVEIILYVQVGLVLLGAILFGLKTFGPPHVKRAMKRGYHGIHV